MISTENAFSTGDQKLDQEFSKNMGLLGAHMINQMKKGAEDELRASSSRSLVTRDKDFGRFSDRSDRHGGLLNDDTIDILRATTYNVRIANAIHDIVDPLKSGLEDMGIDNRTLQLELAKDQLEMLRKINLNILDQGDVTDDWVGKTTTFYRRLIDHPGLTALTLFGSSVGFLVKGVAKTTKMALLGVGDTRDGFEKIVDSVDKLREFMMNDSVDQRKGFLSRLKSGGLLGAAGYGAKVGAGRLLGITSGVAQANEDKRSRGIEVDTSLRGKLSDKLFGEQIVKRNVGERNVKQLTLVDAQLSEIKEWKHFRDRVLTALERTGNIYDQRGDDDIVVKDIGGSNLPPPSFTDLKISKSERNGVPLIGFDEGTVSSLALLTKLTPDQFSILDDSKELLEMSSAQNDHMIKTGDMAMKMQEVGLSSANITNKRLNSILDVQEDLFDETKLNTKFQEKTFKESARTRRLMQLKAIVGAVMGAVKTVVSSITGLVKSIPSIVGGAIATVGATIAGAKFLKNRGSAKSTPTPGVPSAPGQPSRLGKLAKIGGRIIAPVAAVGSFVNTGEELDAKGVTGFSKTAQQTAGAGGLLAGAAGGAKAGALAGSLVGPIGTVVGGILGGVAGGLFGEQLGKKVGEQIAPIGDNIISRFKSNEGEESEAVKEREKTFTESIKASTMGVINSATMKKDELLNKAPDIKDTIMSSSGFSDFSSRIDNILRKNSEQMKVMTDEFVGMTKIQTENISKAIRDAISSDKGPDKIVDSIETMTDKLSKTFSETARTAQNSAPQMQFSPSPDMSDVMNMMGR